jgi:hypothetical protein
LSIDNGVFPDSLKKAQVTPLLVWHPCSRRKAHKKGLNIVSKKSDNCVSNTFSKILEKTGRTLTGL